jgi:hypothetical protein
MDVPVAMSILPYATLEQQDSDDRYFIKEKLPIHILNLKYNTS